MTREEQKELLKGISSVAYDAIQDLPNSGCGICGNEIPELIMQYVLDPVILVSASRFTQDDREVICTPYVLAHSIIHAIILAYKAGIRKAEQDTLERLVNDSEARS